MIIFWSDEDQAFLAEVPELAGCMADGQTYQEALKNAEVVMKGSKRQKNLADRFQNQRAASFTLSLGQKG